MQTVFSFGDLSKSACYLDEKIVQYIQGRQTEGFESFGHFNLFAFDWYDVHSPRTESSKVIVYMDKNHLLFFCHDETAKNI